MIVAINTHRRKKKKKKKTHTRNSCLAYIANALSLKWDTNKGFMTRLPSLGACLHSSSLWMHSPFHCLSHQSPSPISDFNQKHFLSFSIIWGKIQWTTLQAFTEPRKVLKRYPLTWETVSVCTSDLDAKFEAIMSCKDAQTFTQFVEQVTALSLYQSFL